MDRAIHYFYQAGGPEEPEHLSHSLFGSSLQTEECWMGKIGSCHKRFEQPDTSIRSIEVQSLEEAAEKIRQCGGRLIVPRVEIPDIGVLAYCLDGDGNLLGILERTSS
ncbi:hypothetical protein [Lihuaxuella thermophila]|uniref:VOC domain-containing protein n=1 Tax=Lihuaxuella thermophila TaxID=1173111 RepID=A0A1H8C271_9BACL|nr:hypothetical protein [Lihuaxuella thermophila]SEM89082.1 hypothetical protein SAMN05444955_10324 [Lihuaxuella thermophila]